MSKEKQCECCHEWWYGSDVKEDSCPNCYYYFKQLKQQLEEYKNKENTSAVNSWDEMLKNCENCGLNECIGCEYTQTCVQNIKQQLAEKDNRIEELEGQFAYECECNKQLVELQKQLAKKEEEIERLKFKEKTKMTLIDLEELFNCPEEEKNVIADIFWTLLSRSF